MAALCSILAIWKWGGLARWKAGELFSQRQCMTYTPPPDQIVYQVVDSQLRSILTQPGGAYTYTRPGIVHVLPDCWTQFSATEGWTVDPEEGVPFLHELRTSGGTRRLVRIAFTDQTKGHILSFRTEAIQPATIFHRAKPAAVGEYLTTSYATRHWDDGSRLYAGRVDPLDAARFRIQYLVDEMPGTIVGGLSEDGSVWMRVEDGPFERFDWHNGLPVFE